MSLGDNPFVASGRSHYESATRRDKRTKNWYAPPAGMNSILAGSLRALQDRSRAAHRNSPYIRNGIEKLVSNEVGTGIRPYPEVESDDLRDEIRELWEDWTGECDADGNLNFYGFQEQVVRARRLSGEVFIRFRPRRIEDGMSVPLQLQALDSVYCPVDLSRKLDGGRQIKNGKLMNALGRVSAYYMYRSHPYEIDHFDFNLGDYAQIPANLVIHHFVPTHPGQLRGEPDAAASLLRDKTLQSYDDAELIRKETRAPFTGILTRNIESEEEWRYDPITGEPLASDEDGDPTMKVTAGTILQGLPGDQFELFKSDEGSSNYEPYMMQQLASVAAGLSGIPMEIMTGRYKDVNDRLVRAILNEFHRSIEMVQDHYTIYQVCRRTYHQFMDMAVLTGALEGVSIEDYRQNRRKYLRCRWLPHAWPYVHPEQDINATIKAIDNDLDSRDDAILRRGRDPVRVTESNAKSDARIRRQRVENQLPAEKPSRGAAQSSTTQGNDDERT